MNLYFMYVLTDRCSFITGFNYVSAAVFMFVWWKLLMSHKVTFFILTCKMDKKRKWSFPRWRKKKKTWNLTKIWLRQNCARSRLHDHLRLEVEEKWNWKVKFCQLQMNTFKKWRWKKRCRWKGSETLLHTTWRGGEGDRARGWGWAPQTIVACNEQ